MLWYLLYLLRGCVMLFCFCFLINPVLTCCSTTEAPVLAPTHPLRRLFSRYGTWAARHVKAVLPLSGAVVFIFLYLFPFLYTTDAATIMNGVSHLPHHVWTDAQPLRDTAAVEPD